MKKLLSLLGVLTLSFVVFSANASAEVVANDFAETIADELEIFEGNEGYEEYISLLKSADLSKYKESDDKVNVYIFRGSSCGHCLDAVAFFSSIVSKYGDKFNLVTYEVWGNQDNADLMTKVAEYFGEDVGGVPYIVIGDKTFQGYATSYDADIISAIEDYYEDSKYVDRVAEIAGGKATSKKDGSSAPTIIIIAVLVIGCVAMIYFAREGEEEVVVKKVKSEIVEEVVEEPVVKKETTKKTVAKKTTTTKKAATTAKKSTAKKTTTTAKKTATKKTTKK